MSRTAAPRASSCASACSTRTRDLDVADGLPEIPTATSLPGAAPTRSSLTSVQFMNELYRPKCSHRAALARRAARGEHFGRYSSFMNCTLVDGTQTGVDKRGAENS